MIKAVATPMANVIKRIRDKEAFISQNNNFNLDTWAFCKENMTVSIKITMEIINLTVFFIISTILVSINFFCCLKSNLDKQNEKYILIRNPVDPLILLQGRILIVQWRLKWKDPWCLPDRKTR